MTLSISFFSFFGDHRYLHSFPTRRSSDLIELIETIDAQRVPAAKALKEWGTAHRYAGSGDRAAIAGLIWDVLRRRARSEEHTSELQSRVDLVCRLLLEKKKKKEKQSIT